MVKETNPFPDLRVSNFERRELINIVDFYVENYIENYNAFIVNDQCRVDERRWQHVKSRDNLHVYAERTRAGFRRSGTSLQGSLRATETANKDMSVLLGAGTLTGKLEDLMFGALNPTTESMRIKTSYVQDLGNAAVLSSVVEPSKEDPFHSLVIKWMAIDVPLKSTNLARSRDFVFIEATGILNFSNGERVGYHLLHSINFPQTEPLPNKIRGNLSAFSCFRQIDRNVIASFANATIDAGGEAIRFILKLKVANCLLAATSYVYCGQMKKLAWLLKRCRSEFELSRKERLRKQCVVCKTSTASGIGAVGKRECKLCGGDVCYSCKIHQRLSFISLCGEMIQRKITFCGICVSDATKLDAFEPAADQVDGYEAYTRTSTYTFAHNSTSSLDG